MKISTRIEIKYHRPIFTKKEVMDHFNLEKWPRALKHSVGWDEIKALSIRNSKYRPETIGDLSYLSWILSPQFYFSKSGLFLTDMGKVDSFNEAAQRYGKFTAAGLINHIHLDQVIKSRIGQFEIGIRAIRAWVPALKQISGLKRATIYLDGPDNYTLCLYGNPEAKGITSLDQRLSQYGELMVDSASSFIKWSLE